MATKKIHFGGLLKDKFGAEHLAVGDNIYTIMHSLYKTVNGLREVVSDNRWDFYVPETEKSHSLSDIYERVESDEIYIMPQGEGAGFVAAFIPIIVGVVVGAAIAFFMMPEMPETNNSDEDHPSYMFNGVKNVVDQGGAVPIVYGLTRVGSTIISSGSYAEELSVYNSDLSELHGVLALAYLIRNKMKLSGV